MGCQTAVEGTSTGIVRAVIPDIHEVGIVGTGGLHQFFVIGLQRLAERTGAGEFGVISQSVHTIVAEELRGLLGSGLRHLLQGGDPLGRSADGTVRNAGYGRYADTVLVCHVEEGSGNAAEGCRPVAPMGDVRPQGEDLGIEDTVGQCILADTVDGNPGKEFLVVRLVEVRAHLRGGVTEAFAGLHTRNEEIVVVADGLADLPVGKCFAEMVARRAPLDVAFLEFLGGNRQGGKSQCRQKDVLVFHLSK